MLREKLSNIIDKSGLTKAEFARRGNLSASDISRVLTNSRPNVSPRVALGIEKATDGQITMRQWFEVVQ